MRGCQNYGLFLGALNIRCRFVIGIQKGTIILTTTHVLCERRGMLLLSRRAATRFAADLSHGASQSANPCMGRVYAVWGLGFLGFRVWGFGLKV